VHPAPRRFAIGIMALFIIAIAWACFGQVDIVAVAPGRIIVGDRTKLIQPLEASIVRKVLVKDGDRVQAGQVLVELDPTTANADKSSVQEQINAAQSEATRTRALLGVLSTMKQTNAISRDVEPQKASKSAFQSNLAPIVPIMGMIDAKMPTKAAKFESEAARRQAEMATVQASIGKLQSTIPMAQTRESDFKNLVGEGFISSHATQDKTRERVELERDLHTQRARLLEAQTALTETESSQAAWRAETVRNLNDRHALAATKLGQLQSEHQKAQQKEKQTQLVAPVSGVIQQLAIHSVGGVVTSAQPLMIVVPDSTTVTAEVTISNQDIGFVNAGQMAEVKLETFPYTKYGTVKARVDIVTADAVTDEKKGSYYPATLTLSQKDMAIDGKRVNLSPGMNITAEIKTGQRRVIEYLLSPVQRAGSESLRER
jgi:hemolysin D